jgi:DNA polymerase
MESEQRPTSLAAIERAIHRCRRCPIGYLDNQAVPGEGLKRSTLMVVGEQPGDREDLAGKPFVGPSGQLLDRYLVEAGIDRRQTYVTNAVKHFKFVPRGKRRLHQSPTSGEIDICRWWLESERAIIRPRVVLALGSSAARGVLGKSVTISKARAIRIRSRTAARPGSPRILRTCCASRTRRSASRSACSAPTSPP